MINFIKSAILKFKIGHVLIDFAEAKLIISSIVDMYTEPPLRYFIWESFVGEISLRRSDGNELGVKICPEEFVMIVRDENDEYAGYRFEDKNGLACIVQNCPPFEFMLVDEAVSFVICFNHHGFLMGLGRATQWMESLEDNW